MASIRVFTTACVDCSSPITFETRPRIGQRHDCANCDSEMEVISLKPLELDWAMDSADWGALDMDASDDSLPQDEDPLSLAVAGALEAPA
jgi:hypothetical protein